MRSPDDRHPQEPRGFRLAVGIDRLHARLPELADTPVRVHELSPEEVTVSLPPGRAPRPGTVVRVELVVAGERHPPFPARVDEVAASGGAVRLRFEGLPLDRARGIQALLLDLLRSGLVEPPQSRPAWQEEMHDRDAIRTAVRPLVHLRRTGEVAGRSDVVLRMEEAISGEALPLRWVPVRGTPPEPPFIVRTTGYNALYELHIAEARAGAGALFTALPRGIVRTRHRSYRRAPAPAGLLARIEHPAWREVLVERPLMDVSYYGCGVVVEGASDLLYPGLALPRVQIRWGHRVRYEGPARVRSLIVHDGTVRCGIELLARDGARIRSWHALVSDLLNPQTRASAPFSEAAWELFRASGYFGISGQKVQRFSRLRGPYTHTANRVASAPDIGVIAWWPLEEAVADEAPPEGSGVASEYAGLFTMLRVYPHTWMACHLAKRRDRIPGELHGGEIIRQLVYRCYEHAAAHPETRWVVAYVHREDTISRVALHAFSARLAHTPFAAVVPNRAIEVLSTFPAPAHGPGTEIATPTSEEMRAFEERIRETRPGAWIGALGLDVDPPTFERYEREMEAAGLLRKRAFRVLRRRGAAIAVAVLETAEEGLHLYGILDALRIVPLGPKLPDRVEVGALLADAASWFREHGKRAYILFDEHDLWDPDWSRLTKDLGVTDLCVLSVHRVPDLMEYLLQVTAPRRLLRPEGGDG